MWESLRPFFEWSDNLWVGQAISSTTWAFPLVETIHILALTIMYGAMIVLDLRLLGLAMRKQSTALLARNLDPYMTWGLVVMLASGFLLFTSEAMKSYVNEGFRFKMAVLVPAVLFQFTLFRWVTHKEEVERSRPLGWMVSVASLVLWFGVGVGGRAIGFV
ncbi:MAG: hypothetical protein LAO55_26760 [Acidobacteriia bacterium]|nr:hypothetical protein [Terriglobia bacterium]